MPDDRLACEVIEEPKVRKGKDTQLYRELIELAAVSREGRAARERVCIANLMLKIGDNARHSGITKAIDQLPCEEDKCDQTNYQEGHCPKRVRLNEEDVGIGRDDQE